MKPKNPVQADKRWIKGFANMPPALPILCWKEMRVKVKKNTMEKAMERPMKTGVVAAGAESSTVGALFGRTETSGSYVSQEKEVRIHDKMYRSAAQRRERCS